MDFDLSLSCKIYNVWPKKVQRSYISWHWRIMQNLKKNWLMVWKKHEEFNKFHQRTFESLKIGTLMGFFYPKLKMYEFKTYRGVICHGNKKWCKIWRGIDLSIQNWHEEFDEFWPEHSKISKNCSLIGRF